MTKAISTSYKTILNYNDITVMKKILTVYEYEQVKLRFELQEVNNKIRKRFA